MGEWGRGLSDSKAVATIRARRSHCHQSKAAAIVTRAGDEQGKHVAAGAWPSALTATGHLLYVVSKTLTHTMKEKNKKTEGVLVTGIHLGLRHTNDICLLVLNFS